MALTTSPFPTMKISSSPPSRSKSSKALTSAWVAFSPRGKAGMATERSRLPAAQRKAARVEIFTASASRESTRFTDRSVDDVSTAKLASRGQHGIAHMEWSSSSGFGLDLNAGVSEPVGLQPVLRCLGTASVGITTASTSTSVISPCIAMIFISDLPSSPPDELMVLPTSLLRRRRPSPG